MVVINDRRRVAEGRGHGRDASGRVVLVHRPGSVGRKLRLDPSLRGSGRAVRLPGRPSLGSNAARLPDRHRPDSVDFLRLGLHDLAAPSERVDGPARRRAGGRLGDNNQYETISTTQSNLHTVSHLDAKAFLQSSSEALVPKRSSGQGIPTRM